MSIPVILLWQCLVDAVVEVLVVRKDDMAADIVELGMRGLLISGASLTARELPGASWDETTHESLGSDIGGCEATSLFVGINDQPRRSILSPRSAIGARSVV